MRYLIMLLLMAGTVFSQGVAYKRISQPKVDSVRWQYDHEILYTYIGYDVEVSYRIATWPDPSYTRVNNFKNNSYSIGRVSSVKAPNYTFPDYYNYADSMWYRLDTSFLILGHGDSVTLRDTTRVTVMVAYDKTHARGFVGGLINVDIDSLGGGRNQNHAQDSFTIFVDTPQNTASEVRNLTAPNPVLKPVTYDVMGRRIADAARVGAGVYYVWDGRSCKRLLKVR